MEGWVHRRDLIDPRHLKALSRRSDARGALQLASQLLALAATGWGIHALWGSFWGVPVFVLHGVLLFGLTYAGQHELVHRTAFRTRWINDTVAYATGFLRLFPSDLQRAWHFVHHRHTKDPERDSEIIGTVPWTLRRYVLHMIGITFWWWRLSSVVRVACGRVPEPYYTDAERRRFIVEARWHMAGYALIAAASLWFGNWAAVIYWLGPMVAGAPFYLFYVIAEHTGRPQNPNIIESTRTTRAGALMCWLWWNMPYHTEHHLFPGVPFHALPALAQALRADPDGPMRANGPRTGYVAVHAAMIRGLRNHDPLFEMR